MACQKIFVGANKKGTIHLLRHYRKFLKEQSRGRDGAPGGSEASSSTPFVYSHSRMREGLATYVATAQQPFTMGSCPRFEAFLKQFVNPNYNKVSRHMLRRDCMKIYKKIKKNN